MSRVSNKFSWERAVVQSDLDGTSRHVALTVGLHFSKAGDSCWPSMETLAAESGLHLSTVKRHLAILREAGWLIVHSGGSPKGGTRTSNRYEAAIPSRWSLTGRTENRVQSEPGAVEDATGRPQAPDRAQGAPLTINNNHEQSDEPMSREEVLEQIRQSKANLEATK